MNEYDPFLKGSNCLSYLGQDTTDFCKLLLMSVQCPRPGHLGRVWSDAGGDTGFYRDTIAIEDMESRKECSKIFGGDHPAIKDQLGEESYQATFLSVYTLRISVKQLGKSI